MAATILVVDDEENARHMLDAYLNLMGYEVLLASSLAEARQILPQGRADIILLDVKLSDGYGPHLLDDVARLDVRPPVILITAFGNIEMAVDAMKAGALDFFQKPIQFDQLQQTISRAEEIVDMRRELAHLRKAQRGSLEGMIFKSASMRRVLEQVQRAAAASVSVLISGETGTGKEVVAKALHMMGPRANKPFIALSSPAIQPTVLESELFGHEEGAFTSAEKRKIGLMELADNGIFFLDEIASMPHDIQMKLLRVLEERTFRRVGGTKEIKVDVQVIAASNRDLQAMVSEGKFRSDLYYRLNGLKINIPPLRERKEEIPDLVGLFIRQFNQTSGNNVLDVTPRALQSLMDYNWPGNVRELRNAIQQALLFCDDEAIDIQHLPADVTGVY